MEAGGSQMWGKPDMQSETFHLKKMSFWLDVVLHACNPNTEQVVTEESGVQGQSVLQETLSKTNK